MLQQGLRPLDGVRFLNYVTDLRGLIPLEMKLTLGTFVNMTVRSAMTTAFSRALSPWLDFSIV